VEHEMLCHTGNHWGHRNCEQKFTKISGNNTRTTLNRFPTETAILGTSHIIRKVLRSDTWSFTDGVHHSLKSRSTREKRKCDDKMMMIQDPHWPPAVLCTAKQHASQQMRSPLNDKLRQFRNMVYSVTPKIFHQRTILRAVDSCCVCTIGSVTRISSNGLGADEWHGTKKERQNPLRWSPCVNTVCWGGGVRTVNWVAICATGAEPVARTRYTPVGCNWWRQLPQRCTVSCPEAES
jgi:hypothetical protein